MPKINQEEYEVLKRLDGRWKWIAVNSKGWLLGFTSMPDKKKGRWSNGEQQMGFFNDKVNGLDRELFRFIQSSDPEPYSIAELIKEYKRSLIKSTPWTPNPLDFESEETEAKNIERLEIHNGKVTYGGYETLSQKWIDEHRKSYTMEDSVEISDLQNLLVPKQELPVIPQFVADWIKGNKEWYDNIFFIGYDICNNDIQPDVDDWIMANEEEFVRAWLDGYTVEEEQKYYLKIGNLYLAEPLGDMTSDIVRMTRDKGIAYQFTDEKSIATHLDKFEGTEAVKVEELEE